MTDLNAEAQGEKEKPQEPPKDPFLNFFLSLTSGDDRGERDDRKKAVDEIFSSLLQNNPVHKTYNVLLLFDQETSLEEGDADSIYSALKSFPDKKDVLLIVHSPGGRVEPSYLISKLCQEYKKEKFLIVVPRRAKSAATLIACGADQIHMGSLSELGPIDPQIGELPALGLKRSLEQLADLASRYPRASEMFSGYLAKALDLQHVGYYNRLAESAVQYAERLLRKAGVGAGLDAGRLARRLVEQYEDHGFVIDKGEAKELFFRDAIIVDSPEYEFGNAVYQALARLAGMCARLEYVFAFTGSMDRGLICWKSKKRQGRR